MKRIYLISIISFLLIAGVGYLIYDYYYGDARSSKFFAKFLNINNPKIKTICLDYDLSWKSEGTSVEVYELSEETFLSFKNNHNSISKSSFIENLRLIESDTVILWTLTPDSNVLSLFYFMYPLEKHTKCFNLNILSDILETHNNYYSVAYKCSDYFYFFLIESKTRKLYIIQNTW